MPLLNRPFLSVRYRGRDSPFSYRRLRDTVRPSAIARVCIAGFFSCVTYLLWRTKWTPLIWTLGSGKIYLGIGRARRKVVISARLGSRVRRSCAGCWQEECMTAVAMGREDRWL